MNNTENMTLKPTETKNLLANYHMEKTLPIPAPWGLAVIKSNDCQSYVAWNQNTKEAIIVDPKVEDQAHYDAAIDFLGTDYRVIAIIDTHTHADHISCAPDVAAKMKAPLIMHEKAVTRRVDLRVSKDTLLPTAAGALNLHITPGHTPDSITPVWGPFVFGGDNLLYGDVGRDDLPGGSAPAHFDSMELMKKVLTNDQILLPGHDHKGIRLSTWAEQLEINGSLKQKRDDYVRESEAFSAPAPKLLKESLWANFK